MCGIAGYAGRSPSAPTDFLERMGDAIRHRGPDGAGAWLALDQSVGLVHRRLAVVDLDPRAGQPMHSANSRWSITFNGEIYNHVQLRTSLQREGVHFRTSSDTEVLLEAIDRWGLTAALSAAEGMWAFAALDQVAQRLYLVRDRLGEKPLAYTVRDDTLYFASDLRALASTLPLTPDATFAQCLLELGFVPGHRSPWSGVSRLPPATVLSWDVRNCREVEREVYWSLAARTPAQDAMTPFPFALEEAIVDQLAADVPVGVFLSGGLDSSLVAAIAAKHQRGPLRTFTIGFSEARFDERAHARAVARALRCDHIEFELSSKDAQDRIPSVFRIFDEPLGDISQLPTTLVAELARSAVTVVLTGDGGDEMQIGYSRHQAFARLAPRLSHIPSWLGDAVASLAQRGAPMAARFLDRLPKQWLPGPMRVGDPIAAAEKVAQAFGARDAVDLYLVLLGAVGSRTASRAAIGHDLEPVSGLAHDDFESALRWITHADLHCYLPNDVLIKTDRATMGVALEARAPFLNHKVVESLAALSVAERLSGGQGKLPGRKLLAELLPQLDLDRPKQGFGVPIGEWMRGPLRHLVEDALANQEFRGIIGGLHQELVTLWERHLKRAGDYHRQLWAAVAYVGWLSANRERR